MDALQLAKVIWTNAMLVVSDVVPKDIQSVQTVLSDLDIHKKHSDSTCNNILLDIYNAKQTYISRITSVHKHQPHCSVLTCWNAGTNFKMNSMGYCDTHRGLALFNGLRHDKCFCDACGDWNILGLKDTGEESGHRHYYCVNRNNNHRCANKT